MRSRVVYCTALTLAVGSTYFIWYRYKSRTAACRRSESRTVAGRYEGTKDGVLGAIGGTPLVLIRSLSEATGCQVFGKCEFLNPGGSVKDRVAARIVQEALESGKLAPGGLITEGTSGSTGISLAMVARAHGLKCYVSLPDDAAAEKAQVLEALGADVERVRPVSITHQDHFVNKARRTARGETTHSTLHGDKGVFADQFENLANTRAHYAGTGPEIWEQTGGQVDAFLAGSGTGGTLAGVSRYLKERKENVRIYLVDPPGSSLHNKVARGVLYTRHEAEGKRLKNPDDTVVEGVGLNRMTANFSGASIDASIQVTDQEMVDMSRYLLAKDGLFVGSSSAMNCVGAVKAARELGPGHTVVTILCDWGTRHLTKFWSDDRLRARNLQPPSARHMAAQHDSGFVGQGTSKPAYRRQ
mmetsp:Transcript_2412/g.4929  ORF Transcript_2412/g.4929 Transcript_2412/m.4929 type:complete len:414 (-) Transcript_2412:229-1470(-)